MTLLLLNTKWSAATQIPAMQREVHVLVYLYMYPYMYEYMYSSHTLTYEL